MSIRRFFLLSLSFAILAVGLQLSAMSQTNHGWRSLRSPITPEPYRTTARAVASGYFKRGTVLWYVGFAFALASFAFVVVSARKHEPAPRKVVFGVLIFFTLLQFIIAA